ncbi:sensor histidine kinase [Spirosoma aerolatum]|uniref:sensor histidine kinase n=1 Tax=Spirosoma aerolatum TaxID=1211326 RepID=UPI0009AC8EFE|nr:sensor histidine kinase [Spirosoma aerolatum]
MLRWVSLVLLLLSGAINAGYSQRVVITGVESVRRSYAEQEQFSYARGDSVVHLNFRNNNLIIGFRSPEAGTLYRYSVKGILPRFIITRDTFLVLPNLPNGELLAEIYDAEHSYIKPARLKIIVESPLWLRWWFLPMMFVYGMIFVGAGLYLLYRYRIRQFLRLQQTRDRIARDLHDDMGSYLSSISILSQSAQRSVTKDPAKAQATLDRIGQTARQVMDSMGDIVWSINPNHDSMTQVIARMTDVASALFATGNDNSEQVSWQVDISDEVRQIRLSAENRRDFFLIYKEAITNAAKYAQASRVSVRLRCEGSFLCLEVNDNGRGFDPQHPVLLNPSGGNGLRNMQNRAALLNGTLAIRSEPGQGTILTIRFPV